MACDIIVAADHAEFGLPEPKRGLIAGSAGVHRLPRQIGLKPAMGYMLTGRHIPAERAYQLGLVNEVMPREELLPRAWALAEQLAQESPLVLRYIRVLMTQYIKRMMHDILGYGLALEGLGSVDTMLSQG